MTVTVIVCAYTEAAYIAACVHALLAQTRPLDEILRYRPADRTHLDVSA